MKTKTGVGRPCCKSCLVGHDPFDGTVLNTRWTNKSFPPPAPASGILPIIGAYKYIIWDTNPLANGDDGVKVNVTVSVYDLASAPTYAPEILIPVGWVDADNFYFASLVINPTGGPSPGVKTLMIGKYVDGAIEAVYEQAELPDPPEDAELTVSITVCLLKLDPELPTGSEWFLHAAVEDIEIGSFVEEPTSLRAGIANYHDIVNDSETWKIWDWKIYKIDPDCLCDTESGCVEFFDGFSDGDTSNLGIKWEELSGDWDSLSGKLRPPANGVLRYTGYVPSPRIVGVKWQASFTFGGATGKARWLINRNADGSEYLYALLQCLDSTTCTIQLRNIITGDLSVSHTVADFNWDDEHNVAICQDESFITVAVNRVGSTFGALIVVETPPLDSKGVALETIDVGSAARFDNVELSRLIGACEGCTADVPCDICEAGVAPERLLVRVYDFEQGTDADDTCIRVAGAVTHTQECTGCDHANGAWVLPSVGSSVGGPQTCAGWLSGFTSGVNHICGWSLWIEPAECNGDLVDIQDDPFFICRSKTTAGSGCKDCTTNFSVSLCWNDTSNKWAVVGHITTGFSSQDPSCGELDGQSHYYVALLPDGADPINCPEVLDGLILPYFDQCTDCGSSASLMLCNASNSYMRLKTL